MQPRWIAVILPVMLLLVPAAAMAQGACVECQGPDRGYRCTVKDGDKAQQFRGGQRALEFVCMSELARVGRHESCKVSTGYAGPCIGQHHEIDLALVGKDAVVIGGRPPEAESDKSAGAAAPVSQQPAARTPAAKKGPPETLEQLARETVAKSDDGVRKAGSAVGGAVKQTWECLASLFKRC